jgi:heat shock protein HslJ
MMLADKIIRFNAILILLAVALAGCRPEQEVSAPDAAATIALEGSNWQLVQLTVPGGYVFTPEESGDYVLNFRSENRLTGTSDCNRISGSWLQDGTSLRFEPFGITRSMCPPPSIHNYLSLYLRDVTALSVDNGHLVLTTGTEGVRMEYQPRE